MKHLLITICLATILLIIGCNPTPPDITASSSEKIRIWLGSNESTTFRGGYLVDPNTEIGGEIVCWDDDLGTLSVYALRHSSDSIVEIINPLRLSETLEGFFYWGAKMYRDFQLDTSGFSPLSGVRSPPFYIEGQLNPADPSTLVLGLFYNF